MGAGGGVPSWGSRDLLCNDLAVTRARACLRALTYTANAGILLGVNRPAIKPITKVL